MIQGEMRNESWRWRLSIEYCYWGVGLLATLLLAGQFYNLLLTNIIPYFEKGTTATGIPSDFQFYYDAASRFISDNKTLYLDVSRGSFWGYLYPPPSIVLFLLFSSLTLGAAYSLYVICSYIALVAALYLWFRYCEENGWKTDTLQRTTLILVGMASGPMYLNAMLGNISSILLLACVGYIFMIHKERPVWGGLCLAISSWIKFYPIILCVLSLRSRVGKISIIWAFSFGVAVVGILLPWVNMELYVTYFADLLPKLSELTIQNIANQSLIAFLTRAIHLPEEALQWGPPLAIDATIRWVNLSCLIVWCIGTGFLSSKRVKGANIVSAGSLLSAIPMFSSLGWGHMYVFALPILLLIFTHYVNDERNSWFGKITVLIMLIPFMIPAYHKFRMVEVFPAVLQNIIYSRYFFLTLLSCAALLVSLTSSSQDEGNSI